MRGDLLTALPALIDQARQFGNVVVFHSAVIAYLSPDEREEFDRMMRGFVASGVCHWISNEGAGVLPSVTETHPDVGTAEHFVLSIDGKAVAHAHQHGAALHWL